jgi:hypothetical protein
MNVFGRCVRGVGDLPGGCRYIKAEYRFLLPPQYIVEIDDFDHLTALGGKKYQY